MEEKPKLRNNGIRARTVFVCIGLAFLTISVTLVIWGSKPEHKWKAIVYGFAAILNIVVAFLISKPKKSLED